MRKLSPNPFRGYRPLESMMAAWMPYPLKRHVTWLGPHVSHSWAAFFMMPRDVPLYLHDWMPRCDEFGPFRIPGFHPVDSCSRSLSFGLGLESALITITDSPEDAAVAGASQGCPWRFLVHGHSYPVSR